MHQLYEVLFDYFPHSNLDITADMEKIVIVVLHKHEGPGVSQSETM